MTRAAVVGVVFAVTTVGCSGSGSELVVSAAASLTDVFSAIEADFERLHPDVDVVVNLGGSSTLREQIRAGAPVDVFASASEAILADLQAGGFVTDARPFAENSLVIGVPPGNPGGIASLEDLAREELLVGVCAESVPCGVLARETFAAAGITVEPDTEEPDVRALATKISLGELDAGLVYATDALSVDGIDAIEVDGPSTRYVIGIVSTTDHRELALRFLEFVVSADARAVLDAEGFSTP